MIFRKLKVIIVISQEVGKSRGSPEHEKPSQMRQIERLAKQQMANSAPNEEELKLAREAVT